MRRKGKLLPATPEDLTGSFVKSLDKALRLLSLLAEVPEGMSLADIAQMSGLPAPTAHRLLTTLQNRRFTRFDPPSLRWQIGVEAYVVGAAFPRARDLAALARPYLRRLMESCGETANLYAEDDGEIVCIGQMECRHAMRAIARPGGRAPMHCSGSGKAILAFGEAVNVNRTIKRRGLPRVTDHTLTTPQRLRADLGLVRERGFAIDDEENAVGLRCVAAPVFDSDGQVLAAISISGPMARVGDDRIPELGRAVMAAANELSREAGGAKPLRGKGHDSRDPSS